MVVVGAGIVGAASAYRLAERGLEVLLLEKEATFAQGSTGRSAAGVRVQFSEPLNVLLSYHSILEYQRIPEAAYRPTGYLFLVPEALREAQEEALRTQKALGVPVERLSLEEARKRVPFREEGLAFATYGPMDGTIDPHGATAFYLREARRLGAEVRFSEAFLSARREGGALAGGDAQGAVRGPLPSPRHWGLDGGGGKAFGPGDPHLPGAPRGLRHRPRALSPRLPSHHRPRHGLLPALRRPPPPLRPLQPQGTPGLPGGDGLELARAYPRDRPRSLPFPGGAFPGPKASWWGYYEVTPDHNPILGFVEEGLLVAAGFSGHGVQQAAMVGRLMAEEVAYGQAQTLDIGSFRLSRFREGKPLRERGIV